MDVISGKDIGLTLQLINPDNTYESGADVSYQILSDDTASVVTPQSASWSPDLNAYYGHLSVSGSWPDQESGNYMLVWSIEDVTTFPGTMIEEINVIQDMIEVYRLMGLDADRPMIVSPEGRWVGTEITQSISHVGDTYTAQRL